MSPTADLLLLKKTLGGRGRRQLTSRNRASVVLILREVQSDVDLLMIRRAHREGDPWSGHMGLPGGHRQEEDSGDLQTAVRETREEIGVNLDECGELLGLLDDIQASARGHKIELVVTPFVYSVGASPSIELSAEVAEILWTPLSGLSGGGQFTCHTVQFDGHNKVLPGWKIQGQIIWGLTYRIVSDLLRLLVNSIDTVTLESHSGKS